MATEIIPTRHECYEELTRLKLLYNEEHERADRVQARLVELEKELDALDADVTHWAKLACWDKEYSELWKDRAIKAEQEVARLREVLGWYANEQNYTWSGAPGHWEEKIYHKTAVKIPVPDMGQRARDALKEGQE